jgi:hypothetical protein
MRTYPRIRLTAEMLEEARALEPGIRVYRTQASEIDTLAGALGEFAFASWFSGDWHVHEVGKNIGAVDFKGIVEVKTSAFPFSDRLNLLVREDYALKRQPPLYVQVIIDVLSTKASDISVGTEAVISGFAYSKEVDVAPLRDFGSKSGGKGGYRCRYIQIRDLHPIEELREAFQKHSG